MPEAAVHIETLTRLTHEINAMLVKDDCPFEIVSEKMQTRANAVNMLRSMSDNKKESASQTEKEMLKKLLEEDKTMRSLIAVWQDRVAAALNQTEHEEKADKAYTGSKGRERFITGRLEG